MFRKAILYTALYKSIAIPSLVVTIIILIVTIVTRADKDITSIAPNALLKLFTSLVLLYFINFRKRNEIYYYHNLHISKKGLLLSALLIDMLVYAMAMVVIFTILHTIPLPNE